MKLVVLSDTRLPTSREFYAHGMGHVNIAMHDTNPDGEWKGVVQALDELIAEGEWRVIARVDATTVLERVE